MTDRELLERAAKAAGIFLTPERLAEVFPAWEWGDEFEPRHLDDGGMSGTVVEYSYSGELSGTTREEWHPLTDDGDAFRLAVKLGINPGQCFQIVIDGEISRTGVRYSARSGGYDTLEEHGIDPYSATRRAIVLAAAAMAV